MGTGFGLAFLCASASLRADFGCGRRPAQEATGTTTRCFHQLYDKMYREDILAHAYRPAKSQNGAPGVEGVSFAEIEKWGEGPWLAALGKELHDKTYRAIDNYTYDRVVRFLKKRRRVP